MNSLLSALLIAQSAPMLSIDGEGWMRLSREGRTVFTREASLTVVKGKLGTGDATFLPVIAVSEKPESFRVTRDGTVMATFSGRETTLGRLVLAQFAPGTPMNALGAFSTSASRAQIGAAGENGAGWFKMGATSGVQRPVPQTRILSESTSNAHIRVRTESVVNGKTFTLADIADLRLPQTLAAQIGQVVVGDVPPIGIDRKVDRDRIMVRLRVAGFDPNAWTIEVPEAAVVRRPSQSIEHSAFVSVAMPVVAAQAGAQAEIKDLNPLPPLVVGVGEVTLNALAPSLSNNKATIRVEVRLNGQVINSRTLQFSIAGRVAMPKIGTMVTVRTKSAGVRVQFTAKVTAISGLSQVEIQTAEGTKLIGNLVEPGVVEISL